MLIPLNCNRQSLKYLAGKIDLPISVESRVSRLSFVDRFTFSESGGTCLTEGESSLLPLLASALRASRGPMSVRAMADSFLWRSWDAAEATDGAALDGWTSVSDSSSVSDSVSSEELLVSSSSSSSSSFFFVAGGSSRGVWIGGGGAARLPAKEKKNKNKNS